MAASERAFRFFECLRMADKRRQADSRNRPLDVSRRARQEALNSAEAVIPGAFHATLARQMTGRCSRSLLRRPPRVILHPSVRLPACRGRNIHRGRSVSVSKARSKNAFGLIAITVFLVPCTRMGEPDDIHLVTSDSVSVFATKQESISPSVASPLAVLDPDARVPVLDCIDEGDYSIYKVRLSDGRAGFVSDGDYRLQDKHFSDSAWCGAKPRNPSYLYVSLQGKWSSGYNPNDVPTVDGTAQAPHVQPDRVNVRIERPPPHPRWSAEERKQWEQIDRQEQQTFNAKAREIAGLKCADWCVGPAGVDTVHLRYWQRGPSFVEIHASYTSSRYGGLLVWWHTYTSDISHWRDVDDEVWRLVAQWNLLDNAESATGQHANGGLAEQTEARHGSGAGAE